MMALRRQVCVCVTLLGVAGGLAPPRLRAARRVATALRSVEAAEALTVYSTAGCPHCVRCKRALEEALVAFETVDVSEAGARAALEAKSGASSVPQVYLGELRVGGADETIAALADGSLVGLGVARAAPRDEGLELDAAPSVDVVALSVPGRSLNVLKAGPGDEAPAGEATARSLQLQALALVDAHVDRDGLVDYGALRRSAVFAAFVETAARLPAIDATFANDDAFLINLYNALVLHATVVLGKPADTPEARTAFFSGATGATYDVAGATLSLDDIEHAILRRGPRGDARAFARDDPRRATFAEALARPFDPRVHFALNCGAKSCPPVKCFAAETLDSDLAAAARAFVASETTVDGTDVTTSKLLFWYGADFAPDDAAAVARLATYVAGTPLGDALEAASKLYAPTLRFNDYDWAANESPSGS